MKLHIKNITKKTSFSVFRSPVSILHFSILFLMTIVFSSCEDVIDVKLSDENLNLIGVEAGITTQESPSVFLYKTLKVDQDQTYPGISGAVVTISDNSMPENKITSLTVADINKLIKKYFKTFDKWTVVNAGDFVEHPITNEEKKVD